MNVKKLIVIITIATVYVGSVYAEQTVTSSVSKNAVSNNWASAKHGAQATSDSEGVYLGNRHPAVSAIDGNVSTDWCNSWNVPGWLTVQFDKIYTINSVSITWGIGAHDQSFSISLSNDGKHWETVVDERASKTDAGPQTRYHGNTKVLQEKFNISPQKARYMRVVITKTSAPLSHIFQAIIHEVGAYEKRESTNSVVIIPESEKNEIKVIKNKQPDISKLSNTFSQLFGDKLINSEKESVSVKQLDGKIIGIYFSAHWCPPCRAFTPKLVDFYNSLKKQDKPFEIVFVSSDKNEETMLEYMKEMNMPWLVLPYGDSHKTSLSSKYSVRGIPKLVVLNANSKLITKNGRGDIENGPGAFDKWKVGKEVSSDDSGNVKTYKSWTPFQFSVRDKPRWLHTFPVDKNIYGMRLNMPYGVNENNIYGIDFGGIALSKQFTGMALNGLTVFRDKATGVMLGGLMAFGKDEATGVISGGLLAGSETTTGVALGGLLAGSIFDLNGVAVGGLAAGSIFDLNGVAVGGLIAGSESEVNGVAVGGMMAGNEDEVNGVALGGLLTLCETVKGMQCAGIWNEGEDVQGFQFACINRAWSGFQLGLLNFNKSGFLPVCPVINFSVPTSTDLEDVPYITDCAEWTSLQFSLFNDGDKSSAIFPVQTDVYGVQLCMPHSYNSNVFGLAIGTISTCEQLAGIQFGVLGNSSETVNGLQIGGIFNWARTVRGVQFALINTTDSGFQLGLLNFNENGFLPIFPLINFGWGEENNGSVK